MAPRHHSYEKPAPFFSLPSGSKTALVLVDLQNDFITGSLAVGGAEEAVQCAKSLMESGKFSYIVATQDAHPPGHVSFASTHPTKPPLFSDIEYDFKGQKVTQTVYPDHCVKDTWGFELHESLDKTLIDDCVWKGRDLVMDSYSGFADNLSTKITPLSKLLYKRDIERLVIVGLATDYCVRATSLDAAKFGFPTVVVKDACRGVVPSRDASVFKVMEDAGLTVVGMDDARLKEFLG